ncbi:MAG: hypothetical protein ACRENE_06525 [Polyangiaceae bacterium]
MVLEGLRADFRGFGEALQVLDGRVGGLERQVHASREDVERQFAAVHGRFDRVEHEIGLLKEVALEHGRQLAGHGRQLADHGHQLADHGRQLADHGHQLAEHGRQLTEHGRQLSRLAPPE